MAMPEIASQKRACDWEDGPLDRARRGGGGGGGAWMLRALHDLSQLSPACMQRHLLQES